MNYATAAMMLPAWNAHNKFKMLMWFLHVEDRDDRAEDIAKTVADFHININI